MSRIPAASGALILTQAAHSVEEYVGRLWESFPPARLVSAAISDTLETGFLIANVALVGFGLWCWLGPLPRHSATPNLRAAIGEAIGYVSRDSLPSGCGC